MRRNQTARNSSPIDSPYHGGICTAVIGSMTGAMKAQNALAEAAIRAAITIGDAPAERPPLWYAVVTADGVERFA